MDKKTRNREYQKRAYQKRKQRRFRRYLICNILLIGLAALSLCLLLKDLRRQADYSLNEIPGFSSLPSPILTDDIPQELQDLLQSNQETASFVQNYPYREKYLCQKIDLSSDSEVTQALDSGHVPQLMQWDLRWGYAPYGDEMVGLAGCGPTCLSMAYIYLTGDISLHPAAMAEFAWKNGYYSAQGTDWALWTDGAERLGLSGETLALGENTIKNALDSGKLVICSMRPGDFTTTGHFILLYDYDENGFRLNDPNRRSNSDRQWSYDELSPQIKNLWGICRFPSVGRARSTGEKSFDSL